MLGGHGAGVGRCLHSDQRVVELETLAHGERALPCSGVRIERIAEVIRSAVGVGVRVYRGTQQREPQKISYGVVAELAVIEQAETLLAVAEIRPLLCGDFEARLLEGVV